LIIFGSAQENFVSIAAQLLDFFNNWEDIPAAIVGAVLIVLVIIVSIGPIRGRLKYSWWYRFHLLTYLALALAFGHQIEVGSDFTDNQYFRWYWYAIYAFVLLNLIVYRVVKPLYYYMQQHFSVERIVNETGDVVSVYIRGRNLSRFRVAAGQFMILHFLGKGFRWEAHPFSLSCPPNSEYLRLSIKRVGDFTARLGDLQPGTPVLIDGPHGIFTPKRCSSRNVLLIAGGIGITPLRSMLDTFVSQGKDVILLYGNRHRSDIVFEKELDQFVQKGRLVVRHVLSNDPDWEGEKGHINRERIQRLVPDVAERDVFLCGPPPMMSAVVKALTELGVPTGKVHYERFAL